MGKGKFRHSEHLQNVASENALDNVKIDLGKVFAHPLL